MRFRSKKTEHTYRTVRRPLVAELLDELQICPVEGCTEVADSPHEPALRSRGGSITDPRNVRAVCWFHNVNPPPELLVSSSQMRHPFDADEVGFLCGDCGQPRASWRHRE